jgi:hypothetical protein
MRTSFIVLIFIFKAFLGFSQNANEVINPVIFNYSETVKPGEVLGLQGHAFGADPTVWLTQVNGAEKTLTQQIKLALITKDEIYVAARIPANIPQGLYAVWVENNHQKSLPVFINRARVILPEFDEIMPGTAFNLYGKNLLMKPKNGFVKFVDPKTGQAFTAQFNKGDAYQVTVTAPDNLTPGVNYKLYVSNGYGDAYGENAYEESMKTRKPAADPLHTGVPWGTEFDFSNNVYNIKTDSRLKLKANGDGVNNDRQAIQEAIDLASNNGGGSVYLPAGIYKLVYESGSGIIMRSKVLLKGDGMDKTIIKYGYGKPFSTERVKASYGWTLGWPDSRSEGVGILWPGNITTSGLLDINVQNINESGEFVHTVKDMPEGGSKIILQNCSFDLNTGYGLAMVNIDHLLISGCVFKSTAMEVRNINAPTRTWAWDIKNSYNVIVRNNKQYYNAGRFGANGCHHIIIDHNDFIRNGDAQSKGETGGLSLDYVYKLAVTDNSFTVTGNPIQNRNQGETILTQGGNPNQQTVGTVSLATATTVMDKKQEWQDLTDRVSTDWEYAFHPTNYAIAIVYGTGAGQWRTVTHNNDTTLTVDKPWDVIPAPGSRYVIMQWSANQVLVKNNVLKDNNRGIWAYSGSYDVTYVGNKLINSEGIYIRSDQRLLNNRYNLTWNTKIFDNEVINTDGKRAAYISIFLAQVKSDKLFGIGMLGIEVRGNTVQAFTPNLKKTSYAGGEGYFNYVFDGDAKGATRDSVTPGILGTIFENNKAINTDNAYQVGAGSYHTIITNSQNQKATNFLNDVHNEQTKKGSAFTVTDSTLTKPFIPKSQ